MAEERILEHDANLQKLGSEFARYLALKNLCHDQQKLLQELSFEIGVLKSDLAEAQDLKNFFREKYLECQAKIPYNGNADR